MTNEQLNSRTDPRPQHCFWCSDPGGLPRRRWCRIRCEYSWWLRGSTVVCVPWSLYSYVVSPPYQSHRRTRGCDGNFLSPCRGGGGNQFDMNTKRTCSKSKIRIRIRTPSSKRVRIRVFPCPSKKSLNLNLNLNKLFIMNRWSES